MVLFDSVSMVGGSESHQHVSPWVRLQSNGTVCIVIECYLRFARVVICFQDRMNDKAMREYGCGRVSDFSFNDNVLGKKGSYTVTTVTTVVGVVAVVVALYAVTVKFESLLDQVIVYTLSPCKLPNTIDSPDRDYKRSLRLGNV